MNLGELWTAVLEFVGRVIIPTWNDLIQYIPLLVALGLIALIGGLAWMWQRNAAGNRSRVPQPIPAGRKKEHVQVEAGGHGVAAETTAPAPGWSLTPPEGMHLPGPSAWPLLAPAGLLFLASGLVFGPAMFIGGAIMAAIAVIGWLADANKELEDIEEHGHPSQADRDPEKAWPRRLIPIYFIVGAGAILLTLTPWLFSLLPGSGA
ncbi:MAG: hypothetical protein U9O18_02065 [Chloroflexota bacterium]|nr:hypothetical protein [Chloroflexota bacterium]